MRTFPIFLSLLLAASTAVAANSGTALGALKLLPRGEAKNVARIEARDGTPAPERWHILVFDKTSENGLHEYVIAAGEIVASRSLSQFAESLTPDELLGSDALKFDSDRAAKLLQQYALANGATVTALNFSLKREGHAAAPLWRISAVDEAGKEVGSLVLTAGKGNVISHEGFPAEPAQVQAKKDAFRPLPGVYVDHTTEPLPPPAPVAEDRNRRRGPNVVERVGGTLQHFFLGR